MLPSPRLPEMRSNLWLMFYAPDIAQATVDGSQPVGLALPRQLEPWSLDWQRQREAPG
jgi:hypothetical protein